MTRFIIRRVLFAVFVTWIIGTVVFILFFIANPGDIALSFAGKNARPEIVDLVRQRLGLNRPKIEQYWSFMNGLLHGDLGTSFVNQQPVREMILSRLPVTASLTFGAAFIWLLIGIPIGVLAATKPRSWRDRLATSFALAGLSTPTFVLGLLLLYLLFYLPTVNGLPLFPGSGYTPLLQDPLDWAHHLILPWLTVALVSAATYSRITRGSLLEVLGEDYVRTARAKGMSERSVVYRHGLRSALTPIVTILGVDIGVLLGGAIITERIFGLPGIGQVAIRSVTIGDLPVVMGTVLFAAIFIVVANIFVDIAYALLDPRVRLS